MFFQAVLGGLGALAHWQVWLATLLVAGAGFGFQVAVARWSKNEAAGCMTYVVGGILLNGILGSFYFAYLSPLLMGRGEAMPIGIIATHLPGILLFGLIGMTASLLIFFIPIIGRAIPGPVSIYVMGVVICRLYLGTPLQTMAVGHLIEYPGFWASIGFLLIAWGLFIVVTFPVALLTAIFSSRGEGEPNPLLSQQLGNGFATLAGYLPVFMYVNYAVRQL